MTRHHTPRRSFREGYRVWTVFTGLAARNGTTATAVLREAVRTYLLGHGLSEDEFNGLLAADLRDQCNEPHPAKHAGTPA